MYRESGEREGTRARKGTYLSQYSTTTTLSWPWVQTPNAAMTRPSTSLEEPEKKLAERGSPWQDTTWQGSQPLGYLTHSCHLHCPSPELRRDRVCAGRSSSCHA